METTNGVYNTSLYKYLTVESVLSWIRTIVANRMAGDAPTWVSVFSQYNSGTYNNQWMVTDFKLFAPQKTLPPNTFWIAEQIPGYIHSGDMTDHLNKFGYWPSYNIPYFEDIFEVSGFPMLVQVSYCMQYIEILLEIQRQLRSRRSLISLSSYYVIEMGSLV
jgi:hypothetical protein